MHACPPMPEHSDGRRGNGGEAEMRSISETEADEPSRGRRIFQQKNICDRADSDLGRSGGVH